MTPDGNVEGVEVPAPSGKYSEHWVLRSVWVTDAYLMTLAGMTGTSTPPLSAARPRAKSCSWAPGRRRGTRTWSKSTLNSTSQSERFQCPRGQHGSVPFKRGWDYVWTRFIDAEDADAKVAIKTAASAHLDQVVPYANFALLGIGL